MALMTLGAAATSGADTFKSPRHLMDCGHGAITHPKVSFFFLLFLLHTKKISL